MTATVTPTVAESTVTVSRSDLAGGLRAAGTLKSRFVQLVTDDAIEIRAFTSSGAVGATIAGVAEAPSEVFLSRAALAGVLPYCGADIELTVGGENERVRIASGKTEFWLPPARQGELPPDPSHGHDLNAEALEVTQLEAPVLVEGLRRVLAFVGRDDTRPILTNLALYPNRHILAGTDSYRLAVVRFGDDATSEEPVLNGRDAAQSMRRLLAKTLGSVSIAQNETHVLARFEGLRWSTVKPKPYRSEQQSDGRHRSGFPNWEALLPEGAPDTVVKVDREDLLAAARAAKLVGQQRHAPLRLSVNGAVTVKGGTPDAAEVTRVLETATSDGADVEMGVNPEFLADLVAAAPVERLTLNMRAPLRPLLVEAARDQYLLMPIRLNV